MGKPCSTPRWLCQPCSHALTLCCCTASLAPPAPAPVLPSCRGRRAGAGAARCGAPPLPLLVRAGHGLWRPRGLRVGAAAARGGGPAAAVAGAARSSHCAASPAAAAAAAAVPADTAGGRCWQANTAWQQLGGLCTQPLCSCTAAGFAAGQPAAGPAAAGDDGAASTGAAAARCALVPAGLAAAAAAAACRPAAGAAP